MRRTFSLLLVFIASLGTTNSVSAAPNRIWVSGHGTDGPGCASPTSPCRTLQYAHDNVAAGGEIDVLDPAGYGSILITKSISIVNEGVGVAGVLQSTPGADAIGVQAQASDKISLRGLTVEGLGVAANGVNFVSGARLTISNCTIRNFTNAGILILPQNGLTSMKFLISDTLVTDNNDGISVTRASGSTAALRGVIDHVTASNNDGYGIKIYDDFNNPSTTAYFAISNTQASNNVEGVNLRSSNTTPISATIDNTQLNNNQAYGLAATGGAVTVLLSRNVINQNDTAGILNNSALVYSYSDNRINQTTDFQGSGLLHTPVQ
jgi:hypothetical protein